MGNDRAPWPYTNITVFTATLSLAMGVALLWHHERHAEPPAGNPEKTPVAKASAMSSSSRHVEAGVPAPSGEARSKRVMLEVAVYHLAAPPAPALATLTGSLTKAGIIVAKKLANEPQAPPTVTLETPSVAELPPPPMSTLQYAGGAASAQDKQAAQTAVAVTRLTLVSRADQAAAASSALLKAAAALEQTAPGLIWDPEARSAYRAASLASVAEDRALDLPSVRKQVIMHVYPFETNMRIVTLGMAKLGLPDLAVEGVAAQDALGMSHVVMLVAQTLLEHPEVPADGRLAVDGKRLLSKAARDAFLAIATGDPGADRVLLAEGTPRDGDAENRLLQLSFPGPADTVHERHSALIATVIGRPGEVRGVPENDPEMLEARARAKKKLMLLKPRVTIGLPADEDLIVKGPFETVSGGTEWMWIQVTGWKGTRLEGILQNDPYEVAGLKRGARVAIEESTVFDYRYTRADGSEEGNETSAVASKRPMLRK